MAAAIRDGLSGEDIPLDSRILAVADAFDATMNDRAYCPKFSPEDAAVILQEGAGRHWDFGVVRAALARWDELTEIQGTGVGDSLRRAIAECHWPGQ
jgi:putative two-component system response regulator